jgi:hypothetical protein
MVGILPINVRPADFWSKCSCMKLTIPMPRAWLLGNEASARGKGARPVVGLADLCIALHTHTSVEHCPVIGSMSSPNLTSRQHSVLADKHRVFGLLLLLRHSMAILDPQNLCGPVTSRPGDFPFTRGNTVKARFQQRLRGWPRGFHRIMVCQMLYLLRW